MIQQTPPKYFYRTLQVSKSGAGRPRLVSQGADYGQAAHWIVGGLNAIANKYKINKAMDALAGQIDELMSTDGGVLVAQNFKIPPAGSGNSDKPIFANAWVLGGGCSLQEVSSKWLNINPKVAQIKPYYGPGWGIETKYVWLTMQK